MGRVSLVFLLGLAVSCTDSPAPVDASREAFVDGTPAPVATAAEVVVEVSDSDIRIPRTLSAGPVVFRVSNSGSHEHNFAIEGSGLSRQFSDPLRPGETEAMLVELAPGFYSVFCPVPDHAGRGVAIRLEVLENQESSE